jgi:polysaccharide deacetylase family protein (PEP-CTERM system associated)
MRNILTVDVEEYFHPAEVAAFVDPGQWSALPSRIERQTMDVLELLGRHGTRGTFFILGWVAERHPGLVRAILAAGHEIGCHSYAHHLVYQLTPEEFRTDTERAIAAIGEACGVRPVIYRAPSYSIVRQSFWALEILVELGFTHDSSVVPIVHDRYGIPGTARHAHVIQTPAGPILEIPVATVELAKGRVAPVGGGGYLRLMPYRYTAAGLRRVNQRDGRPACVYFHPWELDAAQPQLARGFLARLRTYTGLAGMQGKLDRLLTDFQFARLTEVHPSVSDVVSHAAGQRAPKPAAQPAAGGVPKLCI